MVRHVVPSNPDVVTLSRRENRRLMNAPCGVAGAASFVTDRLRLAEWG